ncbi:MAG: hypothetical protein ACLUKN_03575 [Bacilli bacterium]
MRKHRIKLTIKTYAMKRKYFIASLPFALLSMKNLAAQTTYEKGEKMLIVYYSWSGNTRYAANIIKDILKCDILEVLPEKPYPSDYNETVAIAKRRMRNLSLK